MLPEVGLFPMLRCCLFGLLPLALVAAGARAAGMRGAYQPAGPQSWAGSANPFIRSQYAVGTRPGKIGLIVAPVMLNGRGPFRFMLDTGATRTVLAASTAAKLNLQPDQNAKVKVLGVSGSMVAPTVHILTVDSGAMHFRELDAPVLGGEFMNGLDGILGVDGLKDMTLSADFARDRVVIANTPARSLRYAMTGHFVSQRLLMVKGLINGVHIAAVIDTGAAHTLGNPALLASLAAGGGPPVELKGELIDVTESSQPGTARRIAEMRMGPSSIKNMTVTFGDYQVFKMWGLDGQPALLLGMDVLGTLADFTVDYRHAQLQVLPWPG